MSENNILIQLNNASFQYPLEPTLFKDVKITIMQGDVTAIVGINGSGKSTLLKILSGDLDLVKGERTINCKAYYVPQVDLTVRRDSPIYEYIGEYYEQWWEIPNETEKLFDLTINTDAPTNTLSGGELMKLNLAIALKHNPDLLILDEPTNHLDVKSIGNLVKFIKESSANDYSFLIVSHDTFFLDNVATKILDLDNKELKTYGGNYSFFKEQKELQLRGIKRQYDIAKYKMIDAETQAQKEIERGAQQAAKTRKDIVEGKERDKYILGAKKDSGSATSKAKKTAFKRIKEEAAQAIEAFEPDDPRKLAFMNLKNTENRGKTIFDVKEATLKIEDLELIKELSFRVEYGNRIVIAGDNGTGKTSLIKALIKIGNPNCKETDLGKAELLGEVDVNKNLKWVYIDQNYSLIEPELTLLENLMAYNTLYTEPKAKEQLGKFQFRGVNDMEKLGKNLSGGEMVRLIMAMITAFPIDMIVLDEPTNNLDVATVEVLENALNLFQGAIIAISHNIDFLNNINIKTAYMINKNQMKIMKVDPSNKEAYYEALS